MKDILIKFYENIFYDSLKDREIIQSKLKLYLYSIISFFMYIYFVLQFENKMSILWVDFLIKISMIFIIILNILAAALICNIFRAQNYQEMPDPLDIESKRNSLQPQEQEEAINDYIIRVYSRASSANIKLNQERRSNIDILVKILFINAFIVLIDFITIIFSKLFLG